MNNKITYDFSKYKGFNELFFKLSKAKTRLVINWGGAASSKSYTQAQYEVIQAMSRPERILVLRKVDKTLKLSVIAQVLEVMKHWGNVKDDFTYNKTESMLTNKVNGSQIFFRGMDDPEKIKSIQGITRIWVEEATEFDKTDIDQLNIRLRAGVNGGQMTLTFNPIDELHWIKKTYFDTPQDNVTYIHTTYKDNKFCGPQLIEAIETYAKTDPNFYAVYGLGNWGSLNKGGEAYKGFKRNVHVIPQIPRNEEQPLHITLDENVNPYLTLNVWQTVDKVVTQIDEIMLTDPRNTLEETIKEFIQRYPNNRTRVFIYGDATSKKQDTKLEKGMNFFSLAERYLSEKNYTYERRVPSSNPSVELRLQFINSILADQYDDCEIRICNNCINTIADYVYLKQASDGGKFKEMTRDPTTKVTYQKWGHATDANDYFFTQYFAGSYEAFRRPDVAEKYVFQRRNNRAHY